MDERYYSSRIQNTGDRANGFFGQNIGARPQAPSMTAQAFMSQASQSGVVIYSPRTYEDVQILIDHLKAKEQVIVNFQTVERASVYRILDFMSGAIYALNGSIKQITENIFLFAPAGVRITTPDFK